MRRRRIKIIERTGGGMKTEYKLLEEKIYYKCLKCGHPQPEYIDLPVEVCKSCKNDTFSIITDRTYQLVEAITFIPIKLTIGGKEVK